MKRKGKRKKRFFGFGMALLLFLLPVSSLVFGQEGGEGQSPDFSSGRLLVAVENEDQIKHEEAILDSYQNMYLLQFEEEADAEKAYRYYEKHAELAAVDRSVSTGTEGEILLASEPEDAEEDPEAAADETQQEESASEELETGQMSEEENPFAQLEASLEETNAALSEEQQVYDIALIDTGCDRAAEAVSLIGDEAGDDNGHGNRMAECMYAQNPDAKILSIKALDSTGCGSVSAVYAAIEYAIAQKVRIINLSVSCRAEQENGVIARAVDEAKEKGILVVGAAGNEGEDAADYVPGNIAQALIIGAADAEGARLETSNYGQTVDFNVFADNTSEAAASFSGWLSLHSPAEIPGILNQGFLFATDYEGGDEQPLPEEAEKKAPFPAVYHMVRDGFATAATKTFYSVENLGDGDILYYYEDRQHPAYCIDHGKKNPDGTKYSSTSETNNRLGYVMFHGYPNTKWGYSINEAQFLTQAAVFRLTGVPFYKLSDGIHSPYWLWNHFWGDGKFEDGTTPPEKKGHFQKAIDLYNDAKDNATSAYGQYVTYWKTSNSTYQRMITYSGVKQGKLTLIKSSADPALTAGNSRYSLKGAKYTVYSNKGCTEEVGVLTTKADGTTNTLTLHPGTYYIKETEASKGYKVTAGKITKVVKSDATATVKDAEVPVPYPVSVSVAKKVTGEMGDRHKAFGFELQLSGSSLSGAKITFEKGDESGEVSLKDGTYAFSLADGEEIIFRNIPAGVSYAVAETDANMDGYVTKVEGETEGSLKNDTEIVFTNDRDGLVPTGIHLSLRQGLVLSSPAAAVIAILLLRRRKGKVK